MYSGMRDRRRDDFDQAALVHLPVLRRVARRVCGQRERADDLVQDTFLQAWRSFHRFQPGTNCRAWLFTILFACLSRDRKSRARQPMVVDLDTATETALRFDPVTPDVLTVDVVRAAFDRVPDPFHTAMLLVDVEQLTYREAAEALAVPIGTVMSRLSRGRRLLRAGLAAHAAAAGIASAADKKARTGS